MRILFYLYSSFFDVISSFNNDEFSNTLQQLVAQNA